MNHSQGSFNSLVECCSHAQEISDKTKTNWPLFLGGFKERHALRVDEFCLFFGESLFNFSNEISLSI